VIGYWVATVLVALALGTGGVAQLMHVPQNIEGMRQLGYPVYFSTILGFWKVAAVIALLAPGFPRLKEWAYAGAFFDLTGAAASHAFSGSPVAHIVSPLVLAGLTVLSWTLRPPGRTLAPLPVRT
jgi:hypothetical protein